jgi:hypothetical protein
MTWVIWVQLMVSAVCYSAEECRMPVVSRPQVIGTEYETIQACVAGLEAKQRQFNWLRDAAQRKGMREHQYHLWCEPAEVTS